MSNFFESIFGVLLGLIIVFFVSLLFALPVMWLWNWLMPTLFGLTSITWIQAWGINLLCGFLFKPTVNVDKNS